MMMLLSTTMCISGLWQFQTKPARNRVVKMNTATSRGLTICEHVRHVRAVILD